ncbi:hypothetical protein ACFLY6_00275 [Candidatus Dependentiae bacterium]
MWSLTFVIPLIFFSGTCISSDRDTQQTPTAHVYISPHFEYFTKPEKITVPDFRRSNEIILEDKPGLYDGEKTDEWILVTDRSFKRFIVKNSDEGELAVVKEYGRLMFLGDRKNHAKALSGLDPNDVVKQVKEASPPTPKPKIPPRPPQKLIEETMSKLKTEQKNKKNEEESETKNDEDYKSNDEPLSADEDIHEESNCCKTMPLWKHILKTPAGWLITGGLSVAVISIIINIVKSKKKVCRRGMSRKQRLLKSSLRKAKPYIIAGLSMAGIGISATAYYYLSSSTECRKIPETA